MLGFTGTFDGRPISVQSTGMGCPSAGIVFEELVMLGATRLIRVGTCGGLAGAAGAGRHRDRAVGVVRGPDAAAVRRHGRLGAERPRSTSSRRRCAGPRGGTTVHVGPVVTSGIFYDPDPTNVATLGAPRPPRRRDGGGDAVHDRRRPRHRGAGDDDRQRHPRRDRGERERISDEELTPGVDDMMRLACQVAVYLIRVFRADGVSAAADVPQQTLGRSKHSDRDQIRPSSLTASRSSTSSAAEASILAAAVVVDVEALDDLVRRRRRR